MGQELDLRRVWVTRTQARAKRSAARFTALGYEAMISPLLRVEPAAISPPLPPHNATIIFTSQNGIDAFCALSTGRDYPVITVGDATADAARAAGFTAVTSASGSAADVTALILDTPDPDAVYWHVAGRHVRGSIVEALWSSGLSAQRHIYYTTQSVVTWPDGGPLKAGDIITLYSPRAAKTLASFEFDLSEITVLCISPATNAALGRKSTARSIVSDHPTEAAMITALQRSRQSFEQGSR